MADIEAIRVKPENFNPEESLRISKFAQRRYITGLQVTRIDEDNKQQVLGDITYLTLRVIVRGQEHRGTGISPQEVFFSRFLAEARRGIYFDLIDHIDRVSRPDSTTPAWRFFTDDISTAHQTLATLRRLIATKDPSINLRYKSPKDPCDDQEVIDAYNAANPTSSNTDPKGPLNGMSANSLRNMEKAMATYLDEGNKHGESDFIE